VDTCGKKKRIPVARRRRYLWQEEEVVQHFLGIGHQLIHLITDNDHHAMSRAFALAGGGLLAVRQRLSQHCLEGLQ